MSEDENLAEEKTKKSPLGIILILFLILAAVLGYGLFNNAQKAKTSASQGADVATTDASSNDTTAEAKATDMATEGDVAEQTHTTETADTDAASTSAEIAKAAIDLDIVKLATPRILGNQDAPVKISEHSSFTCGHCGTFHATNFKTIKAEYIDTGKAYIVFDDFPRNRPDLLIGAIARCVPNESYFNFIQLVFENQKEWLSKPDYMDYIKQNAILAGANADEVEACYESTELQKIMADRRENAHKNHNVKATPTIVINDSVTIGGLDEYAKIKDALDAAYDAATEKAE